jgi:hypothetical protein
MTPFRRSPSIIRSWQELARALTREYGGIYFSSHCLNLKVDRVQLEAIKAFLVVAARSSVRHAIGLKTGCFRYKRPNESGELSHRDPRT